MANVNVVVAFVLLVSLAVVSAHSWLDCADWRFNDPLAVSDPTKRRWGNEDGTCHGHARRYEVDIKPFGKMDESQFFRHYVQKFETNSLACRHNAGTTSDAGSNEGISTPRSGAYSPAKNAFGQVYGTMTKTYAKEQLCWRWPAKNHFAHVDVNTNMVNVNWDTTSNRASPDLTQSTMDTMRYTSVLWANCPVPGPASNGDSTGVGSELRPCGGCFQVPDLAAGVYTVQWEWPFKSGNSETYTSCADIEIQASSTTPVNCAVSTWSDWSVCSTDCGGGTQTRSRTITTARVGTGSACPALTESQSCNTAACSNYLSAHVVFADALVGFADWSWADSSKYSRTATSPARGSKSIKWTPYAWQAVFFHSSTVLDTRDYQSISFWIHGGTTGGQSITFSLVTSSASTSSTLFRYPVPKASIKKNAWTKVSLKFVDLGFARGAFDGLWWQADSANQQGTVYIDDIYFQHMHTGGTAALETPDLCAAVTCPPTNSICLAGTCACTNGYTDEDCSTPPSITDVTIQSLAGEPVTTLTGGETLSITWNTTGSIPDVSLVLSTEGSSIPESIASQINNAGTYIWNVPATLGGGTYTVRISYSSTVYGASASLTKSTSADATGCASDCSGHGSCDEDTAPLCACRFGWTPAESCSTAPAGIARIRTKIIVKQAYSTYSESPARFMQVVRADLASALLVHQDQIEVVSGAASGSSTVMTFDLLTGAQFAASSLAITDTSALDAVIGAQLGTSDSSLNRGTYQYEQEPSSDTNAAIGRSSSVSLATVAVAIIAAML